MKKVIILSMLVAFVFSVSAQSVMKPQNSKVGFEGSKLTSIPYTQLKQNKTLYNGWIFPSDIAVNLNGGSEDFYTLYGQTLWPDSTVVTVSDGQIGYVWQHSIGYTFDARSLGFDVSLAAAPIAEGIAYNVDSIAVGASYEVRNGKYDTLLIEIGAVDATNTTSFLPLQLGVPDTTILPLKITSIGTQQAGVATSWNNANKITIKRVLTENDSTGEAGIIKYIDIVLPSTITVNAGQVLGVNVTFIPGTDYAMGDTLYVYGTDAIQSEKLNSFRFSYLSAADAYGAAFFDPFGKNLFQYNHTYSRYQTWSNTLLNGCLYPEAWGASLFAFKVAEIQGINANNTLKVNAYPNPAQNILNVELTSNATATISIVNLVGQTVKSVSVNQLKNTINISDLSAGMYMLKVTQDEKVFTNKFVVK